MVDAFAVATFTIPSDVDLTRFCARYTLGPLETVTGIQGGTVNSSFAVHIGKKIYFLRIYEEQGFEGAREETALLLRLVARGIPTPSPVPTAAGPYVTELCGKPAALFHWSEGVMRCQASVRPEDTFQVGRALASLHVAAAGEARRPGRFGLDALLTRCDRVRDIDATLADSLAAGLRDIEAKRRALPSGLIHGDLFRDNVLWSGNQLSALIDFESASFGPFAYDLMVTTLAWCTGDRLDASLARSLFAGYQSKRTLAEEEKDALCVEGAFACHRFAITRITDNAIRIGKDYRRFLERFAALSALGDRGVRELCGL